MSPDRPVLIVEPYLGGSHRVWAEGIQRHLGVPVEILGLPARWWKWRMQGAAVTLAEMCSELEERPGLVLASDMVDLAAFRAFARPYLGDVPVALYFHESQLTYPDSPQMQPDLTYAFTNWTSALAADRIFFNSAYHYEVFFGQLPRLLRHFPDFTHEHLIDGVRERSAVLEVGVDLTWVPDPPPERQGSLRILWNHRWEHDKDPATFFAAIDELAGAGHGFELVVCGENFRQQPAEFTAAAQRHASRLVHMGHLPVREYRQHLLEADVVVSTALQEFFGISVVEAVAAGCLPLLPRRLSYPGLVPGAWHDECLYEPGALADRLSKLAEDVGGTRRAGRELAPHMHRFSWERMAARYRDELGRTAKANLLG